MCIVLYLHHLFFRQPSLKSMQKNVYRLTKINKILYSTQDVARFSQEGTFYFSRNSHNTLIFCQLIPNSKHSQRNVFSGQDLLHVEQ